MEADEQIEYRVSYKIIHDSKCFLVQGRDYQNHTLIWLQLFGSHYEAKNYNYTVKIDVPKFGQFCCNNIPPRSLDDDKEFIHKNGFGLTVPHGVLKMIVDDNYFDVEIQIKNFKNEKDEIDSVVSYDELLDNAPTIEPLREFEIFNLDENEETKSKISHREGTIPKLRRPTS